eukprot:CAMPEP_0197526646 /NCGR_PEP_ID=MMETSP1318-20131121/18673_1 /TAXON_ID=552666 /ORGANISM="Partenskyella glossopodia, Strain RCC365" /LENGTH=356 /DNA_ID=CAMNT_0043080917 /DNA_START=12 /DNA_END=1082 /DNA_ORIENTATION=-
MTSRVGERDAHQFIVGTHSLREKNEIHVIEYKEETENVECLGVYSHPYGEIWQLQSCSSDKDLISTVYTDAKQGWKCNVWKLGQGPVGGGEEGGEMEADHMDQLLGLESVVELSGHEGPISTLRWSIVEEGEEGSPESIVTLDSACIRRWSLEGGKFDQKHCEKSPEIPGLTTGCFDPHHEQKFIVASQSNILSWDFRSNKSAESISAAHRGRILDIDYNPNRPYHIVSGGEDMVSRFWDLRNTKLPLNQLGGHTHWVSNIRFNRFHDQLLLSSGTDSNVNLWSIVSVSSAPVGELEGGSASEKEGDKLIKRYEGHRDSVYSIAWSSDAWVFASLSFDGTVVINNVPQSEKYKILL